MRKKIPLFMILLATAILAPSATGAPPAGLPKSILSLRDLAKARGIKIGAAVAMEPLFSDALYRETLAREFGMITPENCLKFRSVHPRRYRYDFRAGDALAGFAADNGMKMRGHTLVWHESLPPWLIWGIFSREEMAEILKEHIQTVVGHYRGRITCWDVVNEAVEKDGRLRETIWLQNLGPGYLEDVFRWAHEADPEAKLYYNDYGAEGMDQKADAVYRLLKELRARGVPVHGVGLQMHFEVEKPPNLEHVAANIKRLAELGLEVQVTELDLRIQEPVTEEKLAVQAGIYRDLLKICLAAPACRAFMMWGFTDRYSWIPDFFPGRGAALIFDRDYRPKPAYYALREALLTEGAGNRSRKSDRR